MQNRLLAICTKTKKYKQQLGHFPFCTSTANSSHTGVNNNNNNQRSSLIFPVPLKPALVPVTGSTAGSTREEEPIRGPAEMYPSAVLGLGKG